MLCPIILVKIGFNGPKYIMLTNYFINSQCALGVDDEEMNRRHHENHHKDNHHHHHNVTRRPHPNRTTTTTPSPITSTSVA